MGPLCVLSLKREAGERCPVSAFVRDAEGSKLDSAALGGRKAWYTSKRARQTPAARRAMSGFLEHGQTRMIEIRRMATDASLITNSSVVVPKASGEVLVEDDLRLVRSRLCSKSIAVAAQSFFGSCDSGLCWHSETDDVGVDLNLSVPVMSLSVIVREGMFASDVEKAEEQRLCTGNECGSLLSLRNAKLSEALDDVATLSPPVAWVEVGAGSCCCCCCCCCPVEDAGESW